MLPKIIVGWQKSVEDFGLEYGISSQRMIAFDGSIGKIGDLREWLMFSTNLIKTDPSYILVIKNLDKLSFESQNLLLKPLEEKSVNSSIFLLAETENGVLSTILSRCVVVGVKLQLKSYSFWSDFIKLMKQGPGEIIDFCEKFSADLAEEFVEDVMIKLRIELEKGVNEKRVKILNIFLESLTKLKGTNINKRLALEALLIASWRVAKT